MLGEKAGPRVARSYRRMREDCAQLSKIGRQTGNVELIQRAQRVVECRLKRMRRVRLADELGEHRIKLRRRRIAEICAGIDSHSGTCRLLVRGQNAGPDRDDARLYGKTARRFDRGLIGDPESFERLTRRDAELGLDQVDAHNLLGHSVLNLDAGIALDEKMFAAFRVDQELDVPGVHKARCAREADRVFQQASPKASLQPRSRRDLDNFLISKLDRAIAFVEMNDAAVAVGQDLDLDMPWSRNQLLDKH